MMNDTLKKVHIHETPRNGASNKKVSVITPSFNQGQYLEETILSVLNQTYSNVELLVLDGGSTDGSVDILERYRGQLWYRSKKDDGQTAAINEGFKKATGDIVTWLNSDDLFYNEHTLAQVVDAFQKSPELDALFGDFVIINPRGNILSQRKQTKFDLSCLLYGYCYITPSIFVRRGTLERFGDLDETFRYIFDWEFYLRLGKKGAEIGHIKAYLFRHRFHLDSVTIGTPEKQVQEINRFHEIYGNKLSNRRVLGKFVELFYRLKRWLLGIVLRGNVRLPFTDIRLRKKMRKMRV